MKNNDNGNINTTPSRLLKLFKYYFNIRKCPWQYNSYQITTEYKGVLIKVILLKQCCKSCFD